MNLFGLHCSNVITENDEINDDWIIHFREILIEESNVQRVDSPVTVSVI